MHIKTLKNFVFALGGNSIVRAKTNAPLIKFTPKLANCLIINITENSIVASKVVLPKGRRHDQGQYTRIY